MSASRRLCLGDAGPGPRFADRRLDQFSTTDRTNKAVDNNAEHGWAALVAYRWDVRPDVHLVFEGLHIDSDRPERVAWARRRGRPRRWCRPRCGTCSSPFHSGTS
jgi:hypothetical protein